MTPEALRQLLRIAEARKARDLAALDRLVAEDRRLEAEIAALAGTAARDAASGAATPLAQQGLRLAWADARIRAARQRRRDLAAPLAAARTVAARSLGKHRALEDLAERADRSLLQRRDARREREAPPPDASR